MKIDILFARIAVLAIPLALVVAPKAASAQELLAPVADSAKTYSFDEPIAAPYVSAGESSSLPKPQTSAEDLDVTWRKLPHRFLEDQKNMWLFPLKLAEGKHWLPTLLIVGGTAGFIVADPHIMPHVRETDSFHTFNRYMSSTVSGAAIAVIPVGFYAISLLRHNTYDQGTGLLTGEAVLDDTILMIVMKAASRRARPSDRPIQGPYNDTFYNSPTNSPFGKGSSFPSGHAMMGFSVATVFAERYKQHRWVPYVAYGLASVISFARVTTGAHFPSDVFIGATLGFAIAKFDVLRVRF
ncbi:MAG TPA: phosphatase PAP2 family protein [Candidatus Acidoferrum sp.]|jgi:membrane-associated phospholipid phosphatase